MKNKRILVLGYFGYNTNQLDGQTVKTRDVYRLAKELYGENVNYFDTQVFKTDRKSIFKMYWEIIKSDTVLYLPAHNNLKYLFPTIYVLTKLLGINLHYFVVGGWLDSFIKNLPVHRYMLKSIKGIHVETNMLRTKLENGYNMTNIDCFPNFRFFEDKSSNLQSVTSTIVEVNNEADVLRLCFISRVEKSKGLDTLKLLYEKMKSLNIHSKLKIDFYGEKRDNYWDENFTDIEIFEYKRILNSENVIPTLRMYDALIFPTHYEGEGCPGIIIEALIAGVPIIASDWKYNGEFVKDRVNGFLCETYNVNDYIRAIESLFSDRLLREDMAHQAIRMSKEYSSLFAAQKLQTYLSGDLKKHS